jgi:hypothetical protein
VSGDTCVPFFLTKSDIASLKDVLSVIFLDLKNSALFFTIKSKKVWALFPLVATRINDCLLLKKALMLF